MNTNYSDETVPRKRRRKSKNRYRVLGTLGTQGLASLGQMEVVAVVGVAVVGYRYRVPIAHHHIPDHIHPTDLYLLHSITQPGPVLLHHRQRLDRY